MHPLEDGAADHVMDTLFKENKESSFVENAEVVAEMFEYLPGFVDGAQQIFSETSHVDMLMHPQKDNSSSSLQVDIAAECRQSVSSAKFDDLEICHNSLMLDENNTGKMFAGIVFEPEPEHEFIMQMTSETSGTILVPSKHEKEHSTQKVDLWSPKVCVFQHANKQETILQGTGQLKVPVVFKSLHRPDDNTDENANCDTCLQKHVSEVYLQHEENTNKNFQAQCNHLVRDDITSKLNSEGHETVDRFSTLGAVGESDDATLLQNEENPTMYLEGEQHINMGRAIISLKQHTEEREKGEDFLVLGDVSKPDIQASTDKNNENVDQSLHVSMEGNVKIDKHEEFPEKQLERENRCVLSNGNDNASRQHTAECINFGKLSILKAFNKPDSGIEEVNLRDEEKPYPNTNQQLSIVSEGGAKVLQKAYNNSNDFSIGDLVWAKVKSYPWWPAQVFDPTHASEAAKKLKQSGRVLLAFFGDRTFAWLQKSQLIAFQPNFEKKANQTNNKTFCKGVAEALEEFCRLSEVGLICQHYKGSLYSLSTSLNEHSGKTTVVNLKHCKLKLENVESIKPAKTLEFIKSMACNPFSSCRPTLEAAELRGHAYGFRACMLALGATDLLQNRQAAETSSAHCNQQKRKSSYADLHIEAGVEAKEMTKKVKTSDITEMEGREDGGETLLALACYHPKLLKRLEKQRLRNDFQCHPANVGCRQTLSQVHDRKAVSMSKSLSKVNMKIVNAHCKRRKTSEAQDSFSFTTSESEEDLSEAGTKVPQRRKKPSSAEVPKLTRSRQSEAKKQLLSLEGRGGSSSSDVEKSRETKMSSPDMQFSPNNMLENKGNGLSCLGHSIRKVAIEFAGTSPQHKCVGGYSKAASKCRLKQKGIGSTAKTMSSSKQDKLVLEGTAVDGCQFNTAQLHQSLKLLARDPLNKADMIRSPSAKTILLRFRAEVVKTKDNAKILFDDMEKDTELSLEDAQIGFKGALKDEKLSKASDSSALKASSKLPNEHSKDLFQAARKGKSKIHGTSAKSSRKCTMSICRRRLYSPGAEATEPLEPGSFENKDPLPGGSAPAASNTGRFSLRNDEKLSAPLQLGIFMQFPQNFTLPSEAQLKAMFVQFGAVQPSGVTLFEDLASAQVVFTHGEDAKAAYKHVKKTAMFGHASVTYKLCHFSFSDNQKETRTFCRGSSSKANAKVPSHKDEHLARCLKMASSLKERVNGQLRAVSESSRKRTKNGQANRDASKQRSRNGNICTNRRSSDPIGDILHEKMMTLIRRVSVIVGTPNFVPNTE